MDPTATNECTDSASSGANGCLANISRLTIVGPLHPHSGGIANHTSELADELERRLVVQRISYRVLYPKLLYPGEYRAKVDDKNPNSPHRLHYANPLTWIDAARRIRQFNPDAVVMTWWTFFLTPVNRVLVALLRRRNIPVFFICHNVFDHEGHPLKSFCSRSVLKHANGCIVHAEQERDKIVSFAPAMRVLKTPLFCSRAETKTSQQQPESYHKPLRLLFFGYVRPYKGLADLASALPLVDKLEIELAVVGEWWRAQPELRSALLNTAIKVTSADHFVSETDKKTWFEWADGVILPYRSATASGVVAEAYNHGKPVLTTAVGGIPEVVDEGRTGFLAQPANPRSLADAIERFHAAVTAGTRFQPSLTTMRQSLEVGHYADNLLSFIALDPLILSPDRASVS